MPTSASSFPFAPLCLSQLFSRGRVIPHSTGSRQEAPPSATGALSSCANPFSVFSPFPFPTAPPPPRFFHLTHLPLSPTHGPHQLGVGWLTQGSVEFQDVVLVYRPGLPNALDGVTFRVQPGEKLGIVGRTGSGKSSLLLVLFRLLEPSSGRVLLDGVDTSQLELAELRSGGGRGGEPDYWPLEEGPARKALYQLRVARASPGQDGGQDKQARTASSSCPGPDIAVVSRPTV